MEQLRAGVIRCRQLKKVFDPVEVLRFFIAYFQLEFVMECKVRKVVMGAGQHDLAVVDENAVSIALVASLVVCLPHETKPLTLKLNPVRVRHPHPRILSVESVYSDGRISFGAVGLPGAEPSTVLG